MYKPQPLQKCSEHVVGLVSLSRSLLEYARPCKAHLSLVMRSFEKIKSRMFLSTNPSAVNLSVIAKYVGLYLQLIRGTNSEFDDSRPQVQSKPRCATMKPLRASMKSCIQTFMISSKLHFFGTSRCVPYSDWCTICTHVPRKSPGRLVPRMSILAREWLLHESRVWHYHRR